MAFRMHLHNAEVLSKQTAAESYVGSAEQVPVGVRQFGFHVPTCCGFIPQCNEWTDDWAVSSEKRLCEDGILKRSRFPGVQPDRYSVKDSPYASKGPDRLPPPTLFA